MEIHRIVDPAFDVNLYCVVQDEGLVVDSGTGLQAPEAVRQVRGALGGVPLRHLILTHRHVDHVGGAAALAEAFGIRPQISPDDAPPLRQGDQESLGASLFGTRVVLPEVATVAYATRLELGGMELEVLHTPGHTVGSICLLMESGDLFTGDTVFAYGGIGRWDLDTGSYPDLLASLQKLETLDATNLYPGHGPPVRGEAPAHLRLAVEMAEAAGP